MIKNNVECAVIGAIITYEDAYSRVCDKLTTEMFADTRHQWIWQACLNLTSQQKAVELFSISEQLEADRHPIDISYLMDLSAECTTSVYIETHAELIYNAWKKRSYDELGIRISQRAKDAAESATDIQQYVEAEVSRLSQTGQRGDFVTAEEGVTQLYDALNAAMSHHGELTGVASGFSELDSTVNGWQPSSLVIIAARPAMGKTAFAISMMVNMCVGRDTPAAIFSLEMSSLELMQRVACNVTSVPAGKLRNGSLDNQDLRSFDRGMTKVSGKPLYIDDTAGLSVFDVASRARRAVRQYGVRVIIIDYLQLLSAKGARFSGRQEEVSIISRQLKGLAKELKIPVIALSQLNRSVEGRDGIDGKRPKLSDLRESGAIEQDADIVCFLHRPEYYKIYTDEENRDMHGKAEFIIAKHRAGALRTILLNFCPELTRFSDPSEWVPQEVTQENFALPF